MAAERRRTAWVTGGLGCLAMLWLLVLLQSPDTSTFGVGLFVEVLTTLPLVVVVARLRRLSTLLKRAKALDETAQEADAESLRIVDESLMHLARLVSQIRPGPVRAAAEDSFSSAERACKAWRRLIDRESDIESLVALTGNDAARRSLQKSLADCRQETAQIRGEVEELAAATAELVTVSDGDVTEEVARVGAAGERIALLADSLEEVNLLADGSPPAMKDPLPKNL